MRTVLLISVLLAWPVRMAALPTLFVPNVGQAPAEVRFVAEAGGVRAGFLEDGVVYAQGNAQLRVRFLGVEPGRVQGIHAVEGRANFLRGSDPQQWHTAVPVFDGVRYRGLYPGIDATYAASGSQLKSEFHLAPGADAGQIRMEYPGARSTWVDGDGGLHVDSDSSEFREDRPVAYNVAADGAHRSVVADYHLNADGTVGFQLGPYDPSLPLVIDPVITYSTFLGGSGFGAVTAVARDGLGNLYAAGWTEALDFPIAGAYQATNRGGVDAFVVKLDPRGSSLLYATYIGGSGDDRPAGIAVDASGFAYVVGATGSSNFPLASAARSSFVGGKEAFAFKLNAAGIALAYSTYLGGSNVDSATAVAVDASGYAYVTGDTYSADFGVVSAVQPAFGGRVDAFVTKLDSGGVVRFSTFLGGALDEHAGGIATDGTGIVYVAGGTLSTNFPVAAAIQALNAGGQDAFVTKIQTSGTPQVLYSTYLGGTGGSALAPEQANAVALDGGGNAYITGVVSSTNFPVTSGTLQVNAGGSRDVFVTKLNPAGTARLYSTYLGWTGFDWASGIAVDSSGNAYVVGYTSSVSFSNVGGVQAGFNGLYDGFVSKLNATGNALAFSTLYGGTGSDQVNAIAVDNAGNMFIGGQTTSYDFPLQSALQSTNVSGNTGWVARLGVTAPPSQVPSADSANIVYGNGGAATVTVQFSHPAGASALSSIAMLLSRTASIDFACYITFTPATNTLTLANNVASSGGGALTPGRGTAQNSQCQLNGVGSSKTLSGNTLTLTLSLVLDTGFPGNNTVYLYAADVNVNTGWVAKAGVSQVSADSVSPSAGSGASQVFTFVFSDTKSAANVWGAAITINSTVSNVNACSLVWDRAAGTLALLYDSAAGSSAKPFGSNATIQNSQCALGAATLSVSGNSNILTIPLAFNGAFTGAKNIYMLAVGPNGNTGWLQRGTYSVFAGGVPVASSASPSTGSGASQSFTFTMLDQGGSGFITGAAMAFLNPSGFNLNNACYIVYDRAGNRLSITADTVTNGSAGLTIGSSGSVSNSQCTLFGSGSSVSFGTTTVTITVNVAFQTSFAGLKNTYLFAAEAGYNSGWRQVGTWTIPGVAPTLGALSPTSGSGTLPTFTANASTSVSPSDLTSLSILVTSGTTANACYVVYNKTAGTVGLYDDAGTTLATKPIGSSATLQNSQCAVGFSSATVTGGNVAFSVILVFKTPAFSGAKTVFMQASNSWGTTALTSKGTWTVP